MDSFHLTASVKLTKQLPRDWNFSSYQNSSEECLVYQRIEISSGMHWSRLRHDILKWISIWSLNCVTNSKAAVALAPLILHCQSHFRSKNVIAKDNATMAPATIRSLPSFVISWPHFLAYKNVLFETLQNCLHRDQCRLFQNEIKMTLTRSKM